jgi:hypothetical protein
MDGADRPPTPKTPVFQAITRYIDRAKAGRHRSALMLCCNLTEPLVFGLVGVLHHASIGSSGWKWADRHHLTATGTSVVMDWVPPEDIEAINSNFTT